MGKKVMGAMSPQREWIRENMKPKTSPKTLEIQAAKQVQSKAFLFWIQKIKEPIEKKT